MWTVLHLGRFLPISRETTVQCLSCWWHKGPSYKNRLSLTSLEGVYWFRREFLAFHLPAGSDWKLEFRKVSVPAASAQAGAMPEQGEKQSARPRFIAKSARGGSILAQFCWAWAGRDLVASNSGKLWMKGVWQRYDLEWIVKSYKKVLLAS